MTRDALLHNHGGFAQIVRADGKLFELHRLDPERVSIGTHATTGKPVYKIANGTNQLTILSFRDVLHIPAPGLNGSGLIRDGREAIGLSLIMEKHAARLFANGARPSGILKFAKSLGDTAARRIKTSWQSAHGGDNTGGTAVIEEGGEFQQLSLTSVDAQFLEQRKHQIEEIARLFRVPPTFLMDFARATWSNSEEMGRQFLQTTLLPWIKRWEGEVRLKLFTPDERATYHAEFLTDDLLRADYAARMEALFQGDCRTHPQSKRSALC